MVSFEAKDANIRKVFLKDFEERVLGVANIILDAIKEAGDQGLPSGHLYAACMSVVSYDRYIQIISGLKVAGKIKESNHLLKVA